MLLWSACKAALQRQPHNKFINFEHSFVPEMYSICDFLPRDQLLMRILLLILNFVLFAWDHKRASAKSLWIQSCSFFSPLSTMIRDGRWN